MSTRAISVAVIIAVTVVGGVAYQLGKLGGERQGGIQEMETRPGILPELAARLDQLEKEIQNLSRSRPVPRVLPIEEGPGGEAPADKKNSGQEREDHLSSIEGQVRILAERVKALEGDPLLRGFDYIASDSDVLRREGIRSLKRIARYDPEARQAIREMLDDPSTRVRLEALEAVNENRDKEAVPGVMALLSDSESVIRRSAVDTLGDLGARESSPSLALVLSGDQDARVRQEAADALGDLKARDATQSLMEALNDPSDGVLGEVISSLGEVGAIAAAPQLRKIYEGDPGRHRIRLLLSLRQLGDQEPLRNEVLRLNEVALSDADSGKRRQALQELNWLDRENSKEIFTRALKDPSGRVREEAARGLKSSRYSR